MSAKPTTVIPTAIPALTPVERHALDDPLPKSLSPAVPLPDCETAVQSFAQVVAKLPIGFELMDMSASPIGYTFEAPTLGLVLEP